MQWLGPVAARLSTLATRGIVSTDMTISHGTGRGLRFNAAGTNPGYALGTTEPLVQKELDHLLAEGMTVYDIGAGVGFYTVIAAQRVGRDGRVIAFEPYPPNARAIEHNLAINQLKNVTLIKNAVGSGRATLTVMAPDVASAHVRARTAVRSEIEGRGVDVEVVAIDELIAEGDLPSPSLVKIDVEGDEVGVLEGMRGTIDRFRPVIVCELHGTNQPIADFLSDVGYTTHVVEPFEHVGTAPWWVHVVARPSPAQLTADS
jgi:FkbM family methyltransferase